MLVIPEMPLKAQWGEREEGKLGTPIAHIKKKNNNKLFSKSDNVSRCSLSVQITWSMSIIPLIASIAWQWALDFTQTWVLPNIVRTAAGILKSPSPLFISPCSAKFSAPMKKKIKMLLLGVQNKKFWEIGGGEGREKIILWTVEIFYYRRHPKILKDLSTTTKGFEKI